MERERRQTLVEEQAEAARREAAEAIGRATQAERRAEALEQARADERLAAAERARAAAAAEAVAPVEPEPVAAPTPEPPPVEHYDDLAAEEVIALLGSLEADDLVALREHERDHARRGGVLAAIDSVLERAGGSIGAGASRAAQGSDPPPGP